MLALYHFGAVANSLTPLLCLLEKRLPFENMQLNSRKWRHLDPDFLKLSPDGMVPILIHDERVIRESTVINEYLDSVFLTTPLRPHDPWERAEMRVWTKYVDEYFCPALTVLGANAATPHASKIDKREMAKWLAAMPNEEVRRKWEKVSSKGYSAEEVAEARRKLANVARKLEDRLADGREWIMGDLYTLADIKWYSMVPGMSQLVPELCNAKATPDIIAWLARMEERPAVQALADFRPPMPHRED